MADSAASSAAYRAQYAEAKATLPGHDLPWLVKLREDAIDRFAAEGFPTRKVEAWKFTDLRRFARTTYEPSRAHANGVSSEGIAGFLMAADCHRLVFVDGHFRADLSDAGALPEGATLASLGEALESRPELVEAAFTDAAALDGAWALNTALCADGAVLSLAPGVALAKPVHLLYVATRADAPRAAHLRNIIHAGAGSRATLLETWASADAGAYWTNSVTSVTVEAGAHIRHLKIQREGAEACHLALTRARLADGSVYENLAAQLGSRLARNEIVATIDGGDAECRLTGAYLGRGRQHLDTTTVIDHAKPGSRSHEYYKGVLDDAARGVFQGRIIVRPDAQKTDAHQLNRNLLLTEEAEVNTKPELEIHADDVKCSHGATAGEIDPDMLFYMRSRGLSEDAATRMLIDGFVGEIIDTIEDDALRSHLAGVVEAWMANDGK
jgi:Fe-S cluster assembly protein SufD